MAKSSIMVKTCKYCHKKYRGTKEELLKVFVESKTREGITNLCKSCKREFYHGQKYLGGIGSRVAVEELIEVLNIEGYILDRNKLDKFIYDSYIDCDLDINSWFEWVSKDFYSHNSIVQIIEGQYKPCGTCKKIFPLTSFRKVNTKYGVYRDTYCPTCLKEKYKSYNKISNEKRSTPIDPDRRRISNEKYRLKNKSKMNILQKKYNIKQYLKCNGYKIDNRKIDLLYEIKTKENIRFFKDLIDRYKDVVCLEKVEN